MIQDICRKKTLSIEIHNQIIKAAKGYCLLQNCYGSYMTCCSVYEEVQERFIDKNQFDAVTNLILWNAVVLVQGL
jgi:hypothetical protein